MRERLCEFQQTMLDTGRNIHVSRCVNPKAERYVEIVNRSCCENCPHRIQPGQKDAELIDSLKEDVYNVEVFKKQRSPELTKYLYETFCAVCDDREEKTDVCKLMDCDASLPLEELVKSTTARCPRRMWQ